jgi:hypothetical protein
MLATDSVCFSSAGSESKVAAPRIKELPLSFHSFILCLVGLTASIASGADESKKDSAKNVADQIAAIKKEHQELKKKFYDDLRTFRDDDRKVSDLNREYSKSHGEQAKALMNLIKAHGKEPGAFEGILVLVGELNSYLDDEMVQLVLKHHLADPKMGQLCFALRYRSEPWAGQLLEEASTKHPQKAVRGQALYALGDYHRYRAQPWGEKLSEAEEAKMWAKAAKYFTEVTKGYADIMTPDGKAKLGDKAASELTRIKNVPNLKIGKMAPEIVGEDIDGKEVKLSDYRGKVVLLDFWGHW